MNQDFIEILRKNVVTYKGDHQLIIRKAPELYALAVKLLNDVKITKAIRLKLLCAIGYFVIPNDIYPEDEHGPLGYVEDIMLLIYIFREINNTKGKLPLLRNWDGNEEELILLLGHDFEELKAAFPMLFEEVIKFTGV